MWQAGQLGSLWGTSGAMRQLVGNGAACEAMGKVVWQVRGAVRGASGTVEQFVGQQGSPQIKPSHIDRQHLRN